LISRDVGRVELLLENGRLIPARVLSIPRGARVPVNAFVAAIDGIHVQRGYVLRTTAGRVRRIDLGRTPFRPCSVPMRRVDQW
jgi:hypothetical protein